MDINVEKPGIGMRFIYSRLGQTGLALDNFALEFKAILLGE
jgi:hypothetical protein